MNMNFMNPVEVVVEEKTLPCVFVDSRIKKLNKESLAQFKGLKLDYIGTRNAMLELTRESWTSGSARISSDRYDDYVARQYALVDSLEDIERKAYDILWNKENYKPSFLYKALESKTWAGFTFAVWTFLLIDGLLFGDGSYNIYEVVYFMCLGSLSKNTLAVFLSKFK